MPDSDLGLIDGTFGHNPDWLREQIRSVRLRTSKPFGMGFISSFPGLDHLTQIVLEERVPVVSHCYLRMHCTGYSPLVLPKRFKRKFTDSFF